MAQENLDAAKELAAELSAGKVELAIKVGEGGRTFGSVSSKEIAVAVKDQMQLDIDKKKIQLKESIKSLGTHNILRWQMSEFLREDLLQIPYCLLPEARLLFLNIPEA